MWVDVSEIYIKSGLQMNKELKGKLFFCILQCRLDINKGRNSNPGLGSLWVGMVWTCRIRNLNVNMHHFDCSICSQLFSNFWWSVSESLSQYLPIPKFHELLTSIDGWRFGEVFIAYFGSRIEELTTEETPSEISTSNISSLEGQNGWGLEDCPLPNVLGLL